jgi:hypothetical protein
MEIARQLAVQLGTPEARRDVGLTLFNLAKATHLNGNVEYAYACCQEALTILEGVAASVTLPGLQEQVDFAREWMREIRCSPSTPLDSGAGAA